MDASREENIRLNRRVKAKITIDKGNEKETLDNTILMQKNPLAVAMFVVMKRKASTILLLRQIIAQL